jgi:glutamate/tyrosine decarboxylase-like PLP-dependent enzyme
MHGVEAHRIAIRTGLTLASAMADALDACAATELIMRPELGVVLFRRSGWGNAEWTAWARRLLDEGIAFVAPSTYRGEPVGRLVFMHPRTPPSIIDEIVLTLAG